jgi:hypothetical protein
MAHRLGLSVLRSTQVTKQHSQAQWWPGSVQQGVTRGGCCVLLQDDGSNAMEVDAVQQSDPHRNSARQQKVRIDSWLDSRLYADADYIGADSAEGTQQQLEAALQHLSQGKQLGSHWGWGLTDRPAWWQDEAWRIRGLLGVLRLSRQHPGQLLPAADVRACIRQACEEDRGRVPDSFFRSSFKRWLCSRLPVWFFYDEYAPQPISYFGLIPDDRAAAIAAASQLLLLAEQHSAAAAARQLQTIQTSRTSSCSAAGGTRRSSRPC